MQQQKQPQPCQWRPSSSIAASEGGDQLLSTSIKPGTLASTPLATSSPPVAAAVSVQQHDTAQDSAGRAVQPTMSSGGRQQSDQAVAATTHPKQQQMACTTDNQEMHEAAVGDIPGGQQSEPAVTHAEPSADGAAAVPADDKHEQPASCSDDMDVDVSVPATAEVEASSGTASGNTVEVEGSMSVDTPADHHQLQLQQEQQQQQAVQQPDDSGQLSNVQAQEQLGVAVDECDTQRCPQPIQEQQHPEQHQPQQQQQQRVAPVPASTGDAGLQSSLSCDKPAPGVAFTADARHVESALRVKQEEPPGLLQQGSLKLPDALDASTAGMLQNLSFQASMEEMCTALTRVVKAVRGQTAPTFNVLTPFRFELSPWERTSMYVLLVNAWERQATDDMIEVLRHLERKMGGLKKRIRPAGRRPN
eukprot:jgi/Chrzof1/4376/Cz14g10260.t1